MLDCLVVGGGPAGLTTAMYLAWADYGNVLGPLPPKCPVDRERA
jgi:hypothetical protein